MSSGVCWSLRPSIDTSAQGRTRTAKLLLERGVNVEARDSDGNRALMLAAYRGRGEIVTLLLARGADFDAKSEEGRTAISMAEKNGYKDIAKLLRETAGRR